MSGLSEMETALKLLKSDIPIFCLIVAFVQVESDGAVIALPGWEVFPDTQVPGASLS